MPRMNSELVLHLGAEGGAVEIRRRKTSEVAWAFFFKTFGCGFDLSEFGHEERHPKQLQRQTFRAMEAALEAFAGGSQWVLFFPTEVHPEFRHEVWHLRQKFLSQLKSGYEEFLQHREAEWARVCGRDTVTSDSPRV